MDITYIPMARGFIYLAAVVDWFSRRVLGWKSSITMSHQGSQFTSVVITGWLKDEGIKISMDGPSTPSHELCAMG